MRTGEEEEEGMCGHSSRPIPAPKKSMSLLPQRGALDAAADCTAHRGWRVVGGSPPRASARLGWVT